MNVCVIGWMKLVVQSAMNTQSRKVDIRISPFTTGHYVVIFNLKRNLLQGKLQDVDRDRSFGRTIL